MAKITNINKEGIKEKLVKKIKLAKDKVKKGTFIVLLGTLLSTTSLTGCGSEDKAQTTIESTTEATDLDETQEVENEVEKDEESKEIIDEIKDKVDEKLESEDEYKNTITELTVEEFNKFVDEVEKANQEAGLNLRRENLELTVYINNIDLATPELIEKIESQYNYNEEDMINVYLKTVTSYNNDQLEYFNGEDSKYADASLMFLDEIDRGTVKYVNGLFEEIHTNALNEKDIELTSDRFNEMVDYIVSVNKELGIEMDRRAIAISVYYRNSLSATTNVSKEVKDYIKSINIAEGETIETIDAGVLNYYKVYNKTADKKFNLSNLEYESYYLGAVVNELAGYTRENNKIQGYAKSELTTGGLFTTKLIIDDALAYFATTGYANEYEDTITAIAEANLDAVVARTYAVLGSKAALVECEDEKTLTHTNK